MISASHGAISALRCARGFRRVTITPSPHCRARTCRAQLYLVMPRGGTDLFTWTRHEANILARSSRDRNYEAMRQVIDGDETSFRSEATSPRGRDDDEDE